MKKVKVKGDHTYEAHRIVKMHERIIGYDEAGVAIFDFNGVKDFGIYEIQDGQKWDLTEEDAAIALQNRLNLLEGAVVELLLQLETERAK